MVDGVTMVRIDHPPVNAIDLGAGRHAVATIRDIDGPIVLTGAGRCFSAGVDLRAIVDGGADYIDRFLAAASAAFLRRLRSPGTGGRRDQRTCHRGRLRAGDGRRRPADVGRHDRPQRTCGRRAVPGGGAGDLPIRDGSVGGTAVLQAESHRRATPRRLADGSTKLSRPTTCFRERSRQPARWVSTPRQRSRR